VKATRCPAFGAKGAREGSQGLFPLKTHGSLATILLGLPGVILGSAWFGNVAGGMQQETVPPAVWTLSPEPTLVLGGATGVGPEMFDGVSGATWAPDGSILVAVALAGEIRGFSSEGTFQSTVGGKGFGPGVFRLISGVFLGPGDTIWGVEQRRAISGFYEGKHQRDLETYGRDPLGWIGNRLISTGVPPRSRGPEERTPPGIHRAAWSIVSHARDGSSADTIFRGLSRERYLVGDTRIWDRPSVARDPYVAVGSDFVAHGHGGSRDLLLLGPDGDTLNAIPLSVISDGELDALASARLDARLNLSPPERRPVIRPVLEAIPLPGWVADISALAVDSEDGIWVRQIPMPADSVAKWEVWGRDGVPVAWIHVPVGLRIRRITEDTVLGTEGDPRGPFRVLVYKIRKGG